MKTLIQSTIMGAWLISCLLSCAWLFTGCAHQPPKWDTPEIAMAATLGAAHALDGYQTVSLTSDRTHHEANPIIAGLFGKYPSAGEMAGFKAGMFALQLAGAHFLPETGTQRKIWLGIMLGIQVAVCGWNAQF